MRPFRLFLAGLLLLSVLTSAPAALADYTPEEKQLLEAYQTGELLRLHILADSDEPEAQRIKLAVRDAVLARFGGEWSEAIPGTGGAKYVVQEKSGKYVDDEAFKKAETDAISVACKMLGIGADVYWSEDRTKYDIPEEPKREQKPSYQDRGKLLNLIKKACPNEQYLEAACWKKFGKPFGELTTDEMHEVVAPHTGSVD